MKRRRVIRKTFLVIAAAIVLLAGVSIAVMAATTTVGEVFHDQGYVYLSKLEPAKGESIKVKLRAKKGDLKSAVLRYTTESFSTANPTSNWTEVAMEKGTTDETGYYEYWEGEIPGHQNPYYYHFKAIADNGASVFFGARGRMNSTPYYTNSFSMIPGFKTPDWAKGAYWYFINPDGFYNGNIHNDAVDTETQKGIAWNSSTSGLMERYGGDLQGVEEKIPYLKSMNIDAIYLNPIWETRQNMGFGPLSYYKISPNLGTDADLVSLSEGLHANDMKLSLDAIFSYAMRDGIWSESSVNPLAGENIFAKDEQGNYKIVWGNLQIDLSNAKAKELLYQGSNSVLKRYLKAPYNIDAWRFDAVNSYYTGTQAYQEIVKEISQAATSENQEALLICEEFSRVSKDNAVWNTDYWDTSYGERGYFRRWFNGVDNAGETYGQDEFARDLQDYICRTRTIGLCTLNLYDIHDEARITSDTQADAAKLRALNICQMIFVGAPCTYYGDEVGTTNQLENGFGAQNFNSFNWNEDEWDRSIYHLQCALGQLRKDYSALRTGANYYEVLDNTKKLMVFGRFDENGTVLGITNQTEEVYTQTIDVKKYNVKDGTTLTDYITGDTYVVSNGRIQMKVLPGGNILVTGAKSSKYSKADVYDWKKTNSKLPLYQSFTSGEKIAFLQAPPASDYTLKCKLQAISGKEGLPAGVAAYKDSQNFIFAGRMKESGKDYFVLGEMLNGQIIVRERTIDTNPGHSCIVQLQKLGADYSAVYSYDENTWSVIGKNVRANYSTQKAGLCLLSGITTTVEYICFGDSIHDGNTVCTPCYPQDRDCSFTSNTQNAARPAYRILGDKTQWEYVTGGISRKTGTGISQLAIQNRSFTDFRILVKLAPDAGCSAGVTMLRSGLDETAGQAYNLRFSSTGRLELYYNGQILKSCFVNPPADGLFVTIERVGTQMWIYYGEEMCFAFSIANVELKQGYISYYLDGTGKILSDSIHTLTQNWTDLLGDYQASFVQNEDTIISDTQLYDGIYYRMSTFDHISAVGYTDILLGGNVTLSQIRQGDKQCYAGFVIGAKQRTLVEKSDGYFLALHKDGYVRLSRNGEELARSSQTYGNNAKLLILQKDKRLAVYINGIYCEELSVTIDAFNGGAAGIATYNSRSSFSGLQLEDLTNTEPLIQPGTSDKVISEDLKIKNENFDAAKNVYCASGTNTYIDFTSDLTEDDRCFSFDAKTEGEFYEIRYRTTNNTILALRIYSGQCVAVVNGQAVSNWPQFGNTALGRIDLSQYHHVVVRSDKNQIQLWIDGIEIPNIVYNANFNKALYKNGYCGVYFTLKDGQSAELSNVAVWEEKTAISGCPVPNRKDKIGKLRGAAEPELQDGKLTLTADASKALFDTAIVDGQYGMSFEIENAREAIDIYCHTDKEHLSYLRIQDGVINGYIDEQCVNTKAAAWLSVTEIKQVTVAVGPEKVELWINKIPMNLPKGFLQDQLFTECVQGIGCAPIQGEEVVISNIQIWKRTANTECLVLNDVTGVDGGSMDKTTGVVTVPSQGNSTLQADMPVNAAYYCTMTLQNEGNVELQFRANGTYIQFTPFFYRIFQGDDTPKTQQLTSNELSTLTDKYTGGVSGMKLRVYSSNDVLKIWLGTTQIWEEEVTESGAARLRVLWSYETTTISDIQIQPEEEAVSDEPSYCETIDVLQYEKNTIDVQKGETINLYQNALSKDQTFYVSYEVTSKDGSCWLYNREQHGKLLVQNYFWGIYSESDQLLAGKSGDTGLQQGIKLTFCVEPDKVSIWLNGKKIADRVDTKNTVGVSGGPYVYGNTGTTTISDIKVWTKKASLSGASANLEGTIKFNFFMEFDGSVSEQEKENAKLCFMMPNGEVQELSFAQTEGNTEHGYQFSCRVPAKEMADQVKAIVYYDGVKSQEIHCSVKDYAGSLLAQTTDINIQSLVKAMLNYGSYAQKYFNYNVENLANGDLDIDEQGLLGNVNKEDFQTYKFQPLPSKNIMEIQEISLQLMSGTSLRLYFTCAPGVSIEDLEVTSSSCVPVIRTTQDGKHYIAIENILAGSLDEYYTIFIKNKADGKTEAFKVSPFTYGYMALNGSKKENLHNLVKSLYLYNQAAKVYMGK